MQGELKTALSVVANKLFGENVEPELTRPEERFGDYSTNLALQIAKKLDKDPREIARALTEELEKISGIEKVEIAGPGFINFILTDESLWKATHEANQLPKPLKGQEILVEFGDPNPFKEMHIGHLYSYIVGDSISKLLESAGATVQRLSYHGDVGLHVAKAIWGMQQAGVDPSSHIDAIKVNIGIYYAQGAKAYEENKDAAAQIQIINGHIYKQDDEDINKLYEWGKQRSFTHFDLILKDFGIKSDKRYLESESAQVGLGFVKKHTGSVFTESEGATVYEGEKVGLHTRVFLTSQGLPTYETKDLGLAELKKKDYPDATQSIIITAHEQAEYFKVMLAALKEFDEKLANITKHLSHGFVSLSSGKMSSRTGEVYSAVSLLLDVEKALKRLDTEVTSATQQGAVKYGFLKHRLGSDLIYDVIESVSTEGNSGPYLQYAHARACAVLAKVEDNSSKETEVVKLDSNERSLARKISEYPEIIEKATADLMPHHIATYLYELAQTFNRFYENSRVIGDERQALRVQLVRSYTGVLKSGLGILNIAAPERI